MKLKNPILIKGNGTSLWGDSKGEFLITQMFFEHGGYQLQLFGASTEWKHYTDNQIEREVNKEFKSLIEKELGIKIKEICWSEQGMQPDDGWDFDIVRIKS